MTCLRWPVPVTLLVLSFSPEAVSAQPPALLGLRMQMQTAQFQDLGVQQWRRETRKRVDTSAWGLPSLR